MLPEEHSGIYFWDSAALLEAFRASELADLRSGEDVRTEVEVVVAALKKNE
jgi:hypothetical protein